MKKLVLFFLIIGPISFGQNCGYINVHETLEYLPNYEVEFNIMKSKLQHYDDSMNLIREDLYSRIIRFNCAIGLSDSAILAVQSERNQNLVIEYENFCVYYLESLRSYFEFLRSIFLTNLLNTVAIEMDQFAKTKNVDCMSDSNYIYFCENPVDYTDEFIQYLLCKYEYD